MQKRKRTPRLEVQILGIAAAGARALVVLLELVFDGVEIRNALTGGNGGEVWSGLLSVKCASKEQKA